LGQVKGPDGVIDAHLAIGPVWLDPRRVPVLLSGVVDGVHHEGVDVADGKAVARKRVADGLLLVFQEIRRPGVWDVGHDLYTVVSRPGNSPRRLGEAET